jgi:hypothetical protein
MNMKPSEELRELRERVATLERERANPQVNSRNPEAAPAVAPAAAVPARTSPKKVVQLDSQDVRSLLRDLEEVNNFLDQGDAEAAQGELDEVIAGIEASGEEDGRDED